MKKYKEERVIIACVIHVFGDILRLLYPAVSFPSLIASALSLLHRTLSIETPIFALFSISSFSSILGLPFLFDNSVLSLLSLDTVILLSD